MATALKIVLSIAYTVSNVVQIILSASNVIQKRRRSIKHIGSA